MSEQTESALQDSCWKFVDWLDNQVLFEARGDRHVQLATEPKGTFWLGRLAPEDSVINSPLGKRAEKMDPCAVGIRLRPELDGPWRVRIVANFVCWERIAPDRYDKSETMSVDTEIVILPGQPTQAFARDLFDAELQRHALTGRSAEIRAEVETWRDTTELVVSLINVGQEATRMQPDTHLYEAKLAVERFPTIPFELEAVPDSFRYDRLLVAIGINCGVDSSAGWFSTTDTVGVNRYRPRFWNGANDEPDFSFVTMSTNPLPELGKLCDELEAWGEQHWGEPTLDARQREESWSDEMRQEAQSAAIEFLDEAARIRRGCTLLSTNEKLMTAFKIANCAINFSAAGKYSRWRPFQIAFLVSALPGITEPAEADYVDTVWFATGGGKTETYLGLLVTAIIYDRLTGKHEGMTAWSRFPLRMLSLQQTQRFAEALAGAELERRRQGIPGREIALGFFVGKGGTPNRLAIEPLPGEPNTLDPEMPKRYQVLLRCPFCRSSDHLSMAFHRTTWTLRHVCDNPSCEWPEEALPFYIVDQEIYRFLPSVVVGTLDKAAMVAMQAAMRGFYAAPLGICDRPGHGYCYSPRSSSPNGCLVPGCRGSRLDINQAAERWAPRLRLQDELHLLRDSLGAVDSHYESIFDHLQRELTASRAKIIASSATLSGFRRQIDILYRRKARVFPLPGPRLDESFWSEASDTPARRYVAIAPRGVTLEFVSDRTLTVLQQVIRRLLQNPSAVCDEIGVPRDHAEHLVTEYGTNVVYGNTVKDVEAARRSADTQFPFNVNSEILIGSTPFEQVRQILDRLENPEQEFMDRIHVIAASSTISHGVDVNRFNTMVMLGLPLTTAEFIQTSARVGRRWPGIVYVLHRISREREVAVYAQFESFITQGDRFVEPIPITRASRRVLALTTPGAEEARRLAIREPASPTALTVVPRLRDYYRRGGITAADEEDALADALGVQGPLSELLRQDLHTWISNYFIALNDPATQAKWPQDLSPSGPPMISLRDVEEGVPIFGED